MKKVKASAPGKLMLLGEHSVVFGYPCIVTAVDLRLCVTVEANYDHFFTLNAPDLGLSSYHKSRSDLGKGNLPKEVSFIETCFDLFLSKYPQETGVKVLSKNEFTSSYGLGSSSASTVAFAKAICEFYNQTLTQDDLFELCYQTVLKVQGVASGFDIAAAIWGGTIYYVTPKSSGSRPTVIPIRTDELPLVVGYTGIKADTATLIRLVQNMHQDKPEKINSIFIQISDLVEQAKLAILEKNWSAFGKLMFSNQALLRQLQISSIELENLIEASMNNGSLGAKLSGAGGGDCMLAVAAAKSKLAIEQAIEGAGGKIIQVNTNASGVRLEDI